MEIDRGRGLEKAADLFWSRGFGSTTLSDLLEATGMGRGSFYAAYGSKRELFQRVLGHYQADSAALLRQIESKHRGLAALDEFVRRTFLEASAQRLRRGCLLVNSVVELEGVHPDLHDESTRHLRQLDRTCLRWLKEAERRAELRPGLTASTLTPLITSLLFGLRVDARSGESREALAARWETFLSLFAETNVKGGQP
ncbi:MAG: TetR/AcrR family transcriptional regulator [Acidobacteriota bacterium]